MELAAILLRRVVETISPVDSEQTDHRQEHSHTDSGSPLDLERIERLDVGPAVSSLEESEHENSG